MLCFVTYSISERIIKYVLSGSFTHLVVTEKQRIHLETCLGPSCKLKFSAIFSLSCIRMYSGNRDNNELSKVFLSKLIILSRNKYFIHCSIIENLYLFPQIVSLFPVQV